MDDVGAIVDDVRGARVAAKEVLEELGEGHADARGPRRIVGMRHGAKIRRVFAALNVSGAAVWAGPGRDVGMVVEAADSTHWAHRVMA